MNRRIACVALVATILAACDAAPPPAAPETPDAAAPVEPATPDTATTDAIADAPEIITEQESTPPEFDPAPWSAAKLAADAVPSHYVKQWQRAENRATCAPLAPVDLAEHGAATPRAATFSGGWAVAYDEPGLRSAFGIAGAGIAADEAAGSIWPDEIRWADGSVARYGLEGGTGPGHLAYLQVEGQGCLYNVWSKHGEAHLLALLERLRYVENAP
jgi:hypothetical protein